MIPDNNGESEIGPASPPPEGVVIPIESPYGDNIPVEEPPPLNTSRTATNNQEESNSEDSGEAKTIKINLGVVLLVLAVLITAGVFIGKQAGNKKIITQPDEKDKKGGTPQLTGFIQDHGYYKHSNTYSAEEVAAERLKKASKNVIWVTSEPNERSILTALQAMYSREAIPVYIITGKETTKSRISAAQEAGFQVHQVQEELETPYSIMIIDGKILMDLSRQHWIWETTEKNILRDTGKWANELIESSQIAP
jgi:hypothetical protein